MRVKNIPELQSLIGRGVPVYYVNTRSMIWYRVLSLDGMGKSRLLAVTPCDRDFLKRRPLFWYMSWDDEHRKGRIRESYVNMFSKHDKVVTRLPDLIIELLEVNDCLRLMDDKLFS